MKTKVEIAEKFHDELIRKEIELEVEIRFARLDASVSTQWKEKLMCQRDDIQTKIKLLDEYIKGKA